jgi:hypothetical protein
MTKYNDEIVKRICDSIEKLKGRVNACEEANICYDTFLDWFKNRPEFTEAIKKAEARTEGKIKTMAVMSIVKAMQTNWFSAAWWLERKHPEEFGAKNKYEVSGRIENLHLHIVNMMEDINKDKEQIPFKTNQINTDDNRHQEHLSK